MTENAHDGFNHDRVVLPLLDGRWVSFNEKIAMSAQDCEEFLAGFNQFALNLQSASETLPESELLGEFRTFHAMETLIGGGATLYELYDLSLMIRPLTDGGSNIIPILLDPIVEPIEVDEPDSEQLHEQFLNRPDTNGGRLIYTPQPNDFGEDGTPRRVNIRMSNGQLYEVNVTGLLCMNEDDQFMNSLSSLMIQNMDTIDLYDCGEIELENPEVLVQVAWCLSVCATMATHQGNFVDAFNFAVDVQSPEREPLGATVLKALLDPFVKPVLKQ